MPLNPPSTRASKHPVLLVGAGPGDPELLTLKAARAIAAASVILVDDLVNPAVLGHASPEARITWVGKRGGCASTPQQFIERLMVREALAGERVVRLKGGDPLVFGRAGEEMAALNKAQVPFEIIPGITSAIAAAASLQASLTNRDCNHGFALLTGHGREDDSTSNNKGTRPPLDWPAILRAGLTVGIYMGTARAVQLQAQALAKGIASSTPVAIVQHASTPQERRLLSTVEHFVSDMREQNMGSPAVLLVGPAMASANASTNNYRVPPNREAASLTTTG